MGSARGVGIITGSPGTPFTLRGPEHPVVSAHKPSSCARPAPSVSDGFFPLKGSKPGQEKALLFQKALEAKALGHRGDWQHFPL